MTDAVDALSASLHDLSVSPDTLPVKGFRPPEGQWQPRPAAVLIAILMQPEPSLVLTVRSQAMIKHAGQVALPGGGRSGFEAFPVQTALREAHEEVGIDPGGVRLLGFLDRFDTITAYRITPVVGRIDQPVTLKACPSEVREVFLLPLDHALDPSSYRRHEITRNGFTFEVWSMKFGTRPIWGATAAILHQLAQTNA
jgi:8-oxo-dGTP pyrophosphatase MutT (NUDIX family)